MFGEYDMASVFQALGVAGIGIYFGTCALLLKRVIGGDSLAYFAGNTVAAALVLSSNFGGFHLPWVLAQIGLIALAMTAMIALFFEHAETR